VVITCRVVVTQKMKISQRVVYREVQVVKVQVHTLDIAPLRIVKHHHRSGCVC